MADEEGDAAPLQLVVNTVPDETLDTQNHSTYDGTQQLLSAEPMSVVPPTSGPMVSQGISSSFLHEAPEGDDTFADDGLGGDAAADDGDDRKRFLPQIPRAMPISTIEAGELLPEAQDLDDDAEELLSLMARQSYVDDDEEVEDAEEEGDAAPPMDEADVDEDSVHEDDGGSENEVHAASHRSEGGSTARMNVVEDSDEDDVVVVGDEGYDSIPPFSVSRVKKIVKIGSTSRIVTAEAVERIGRATAMITADLATAAAELAQKRGKKTITYEHLAEVIRNSDRFAFLGGVIPPATAAAPLLKKKPLQTKSGNTAGKNQPTLNMGKGKPTA